MINYIYQLVTPQFFSVKYTDVSLENNVIIRPRYMAICHADQRYYLGKRDLKALNEKLPMALIHECCGEVICDKTNTFAPGQRVILIPNSPTNKKDGIYENYDSSSKFLSSSADGFMREFVDLPPDRVIPFDSSIPMQTAAMCELFSVAVHAVKRMELSAHKYRESFAVWGDGSVAYFVACVLRQKYPKSNITVVGKNTRKLSQFSFADRTYLTHSLPTGFSCDHAFECVGGEGCVDALDDIINHIKPQGTVAMLGVSENKVAMNTRLILEKGLTMLGCSRSGREDFTEAVQLMSIQKVKRRLGSIIFEDTPVKNMDDLHRVFATDLNTPFKTVFEWQI